ncbi:hypothetical protein [Futiania mangrovi]|uniref:Uncharacterized protein n=1 Tax=Futiania mangrovi TaxID=2959716 RepID=A0A9J6P9E0_9PROT|nr:hypothetical protein [Futiania mangrovii]MCP1336532.1 hypothetical protein [Futiania mangrovii]
MTEGRVLQFSVWRDLAIGALGLAAMAALIAGTQPAPIVAAILLLVAALFAVLLVRALLRSGRRIRLEGDMLTLEDRTGRRVLDLDMLQTVRLDYYPGMFDRTRGLFVLRIGDARTRITLDSEHEGFAAIASAACQMARRTGIEMSERTRANLQALESGADRSP